MLHTVRVLVDGSVIVYTNQNIHHPVLAFC